MKQRNLGQTRPTLVHVGAPAAYQRLRASCSSLANLLSTSWRKASDNVTTHRKWGTVPLDSAHRSASSFHMTARDVDAFQKAPSFFTKCQPSSLNAPPRPLCGFQQVISHVPKRANPKNAQFPSAPINEFSQAHRTFGAWIPSRNNTVSQAPESRGSYPAR